MEELSPYDVVMAACRSRLLFRSEAEYRWLLGVSLETVRDRKLDQAAVAEYHDCLNRECRYQTGLPLDTLMGAYIRASDVCRSVGFDWMDRNQMVSRKKFCRLLFRMATAPDLPLQNDEILKFGFMDCDRELCALFYPDGFNAPRRVDLVFVLLITFSVIKPFDPSKSRGRDITADDLRAQIRAMSALVRILKEDCPPMGVMPKPLIFDVAMQELGRMEAEADSSELTETCGVAWFWTLLGRIEDTCAATSSPAGLAQSRVAATGYSMPGIWIDDSDRGGSRFWVFPENKLLAFCYQEIAGRWHLKSYEFCIYARQGGVVLGDECLIVTSKGNLQVIDDVGGIVNPEQVVVSSYVRSGTDEYGQFREIRFMPETTAVPSWFDWRAFRRLEGSDLKHGEFMQVLHDIYEPGTTEAMLFCNDAPFMTDMQNLLLGMDREYLYVSDMPEADRYVLRRDDRERFWYEAVFISHKETFSLLNAVISPEHPLYVIPRQVDLGLPMSADRRRFAESAMNTDLDHFITIYRTPRHPEGILCFNHFSQLFPVPDLPALGVLVCTDGFKFPISAKSVNFAT